jgi:hypothetical protein
VRAVPEKLRNTFREIVGTLDYRLERGFHDAIVKPPHDEHRHLVAKGKEADLV